MDIVHPRREREYKTRLCILYGDPRIGKSRKANWIAKRRGDYYYKPRGPWWDGYTGQKTVIIDDFYGWLKYDELLKIADRYPYRVPIKGGYEQFTSDCIFITSNARVDQWYKFEGYKTEAILGRCEILQRFTGGEEITEKEEWNEFVILELEYIYYELKAIVLE